MQTYSYRVLQLGCGLVAAGCGRRTLGRSAGEEACRCCGRRRGRTREGNALLQPCGGAREGAAAALGRELRWRSGAGGGSCGSARALGQGCSAAAIASERDSPLAARVRVRGSASLRGDI
jgi:hypothetical protein